MLQYLLHIHFQEQLGIHTGQQKPHPSYMTPDWSHMPSSSMPSFSAPSWHGEGRLMNSCCVLPNAGFSQQSVASEVTPSRNISRFSAARVLAEICSEADREEFNLDFELNDK